MMDDAWTGFADGLFVYFPCVFPQPIVLCEDYDDDEVCVVWQYKVMKNVWGKRAG